jgi:hypothetical protein
MKWDQLRNRERGARGEAVAPQGHLKSLHEVRAQNASEWARHPERKPSAVKRFTPKKIHTLEAKLRKP